MPNLPESCLLLEATENQMPFQLYVNKQKLLNTLKQIFPAGDYKVDVFLPTSVH